MTTPRLSLTQRPQHRCPAVLASAALHIASLGWLLIVRPNPAPEAGGPNIAVEVQFEAAALPQVEPEAPAPPVAAAREPTPIAEAMPNPEPPVSAPSDPASDPLPPEPAVPPQPVMQPPAPPVPVRPPPRPRPDAARPPPAASAPSQASASAVRPILPPAAAMPPAAAPSSPAASPDPGWKVALGSWLASRKRYPEQARQRGDEGTVGVRFTVDAAGRVLDVAITRSSGSAILDEAARGMLAGQRVPPFPPGMTLAQLSVPVSIRFQLEQ